MTTENTPPRPDSLDTPRAAARRAPRRTAAAAGALVAALALAVGVNVIADRTLARARIDLTQQHLYTLSSGTRAVLAKLRDPITLRLFYSRSLGASVPVFGAYADRVREMLQEYAALSDSKLKLEFLDPEPFSTTEDRAVAYGLQGVPVDQGGDPVYFGLAGVNLLDDERTVPFFQPDRERFLEYDLTRLVYELSNPQRPVVGVMSSLPLNGDPRAMMMRVPGAGQPFAAMNQLRQFFSVREVPTDALAIDPAVQVLVLAHAQNLGDNTLYAIDQFVMRGGKLFVMTDPLSESQVSHPDPSGRPPQSTSSSLDKLLNAWGVEAPSDKVVLDLRGAWRVRANPNDRVQAVDYAAWYNLQGDSLNRTDVATADLNQVTVASAGEVRAKPDGGLEFTPLLTASDQSMLADVAKVRDNPDPAAILADFRADGQRHVLMARLRGVLHSAFTAPPPLAEGQARPADFPAFKAQTDGPANLVVSNDSDILEDRFWVRQQDFFGQQVATPFSDNGALVTNITDTLAGGDELISLRSRGESIRPFTVVEDMQARAETRYRQTERELQSRLDATERRLRELRQGGVGSGAGGPQAPGTERGAAQTIITPEQRAEIDKARAEIVATRGQLRAVQLDLRREIEGLETWLRVLNIAAVPVVLTAVAVLLAALRARRRGAARA